MILGIDPGQSGGLAWIDGPKCYVEKMPATLRDLWDLINTGPEVGHGGSRFAYLEKVHAMPKQGVASTFKFGRGFGNLEMALVAAGIPYEYVTPQKWQKALGCLSKGDKNVTKRKAQELFPGVPKITHAIADALLIAEYGRRMRK